MKFEEVLTHFKNVKFVSENLYRADCPACSDTKQHLYISNDGKKTLIDCKKGCSFSEIVKASNLKASDFFNDDTSNKKPRWNLLRTHNYTDEAGRTIAKKEIYDKGDGDKTAIWYRAEGKKFVKGLNGLKMPLYHLHKFVNAKKNVPLYVVEGEKDVETMERLGLIATTSPNGAGSKWSKAHNKYLDGWNVVILADNDEAGRKHAEQTARTITGTVKALKVIQSAEVYPDLKKKGDISDIVKEIGAEQAKARLIETQKKTPVFSPDSETAPFITAEQEQIQFDDTGKLTIHNLEVYLKSLNISVKYNDITHKEVITGFNNKESADHINENIIPIIYDKMQHEFKRCNINMIRQFLGVIATRNRFNPVLDMLDGVKWDGIDRLEQVYNMFQIDTEDNLSRTLIKKWFMQCICGLHNNSDNPFSLDIVLIFQGQQGAGKTRFFEHIAMSKKLFGEGVIIDPRNKDTHITATSRWICELGEIGTTMKKDVDSLKAFLTLSSDTYRMPYGHTNLEYNRMTSFCGTTNDERFLIDETGNRRFATVPLKSDLYIDYAQVKAFDSLQFWSQIVEIIETEIKRNNKSYANVFRLTREELTLLNDRNREFEKLLKGEEEVTDVLYKLEMMKQDKTKNVVIEYMTVTEFISQHTELNKLNVRQVGKVLDKLGYFMTKKKINGVSTKVRALPKFKGILNYPNY